MVLSPSGFAQGNPYDSDPAAIRAGKALFDAKCAVCHGANAKGLGGIDAPDLTELWALGRSDAQVFQTIEEGVEGSVMPPHPAADEQTWAIVSYVKSLAVNSAEEFVQGDKSNGRALFQEKCVDCHRVSEAGQISGGRLGPNLSNITSRRSRAALEQSLRSPGAIVGRGYKTIVVTTIKGETLRGVIKSEDAFSIQIMTLNETLRAFQRDSLSKTSLSDVSLMPLFDENQLDQRALDDLFNYLNNL